MVLPSDCSIAIFSNPTNFPGIFVCCSISYIYIFFMEAKACFKSINNTCKFMLHSCGFSTVCLNVNIQRVHKNLELLVALALQAVLNRARNSRCTVITDLDTSKRSTQKAFSYCDAILETSSAAP
jgi:hypothetical protein